MWKRPLSLLLLLCLFSPFTSLQAKSYNGQNFDSNTLYQAMGLAGKINFTAFDQAVKGYNLLPKKYQPRIVLIDFSLPSTAKRFFVLDLEKQKLLTSSLVAHGKNSGSNYATSFSNELGSNKSALGFYLTGTTYQGKNGYSLILNGLEKGINDQAKTRAIVIHGASYAEPKTIALNGRLGRSLGCPALPKSVSHAIIDQIKNGVLLYIYANNQDYIQQSAMLTDNRKILRRK